MYQKSTRCFLETLYSHFGGKLISLFCGPMYKWNENDDDDDDDAISLAGNEHNLPCS